MDPTGPGQDGERHSLRRKIQGPRRRSVHPNPNLGDAIPNQVPNQVPSQVPILRANLGPIRPNRDAIITPTPSAAAPTSVPGRRRGRRQSDDAERSYGNGHQQEFA